MRPRVTVLCGGLGGARLALGLQEAGLEGETCFVTNVADDTVWDGALVCPDTDAVLYSLAGIFDHERGWGIRGDTFPPPGSGWFGVGGRDRAHHLRRKALLERAPLSEATDVLAEELRISATVVPATDATVHTIVRRDGTWTAFQEWLVRDHAPAVDAVAYAGVDDAAPAPGVLDAISRSDLVVVASSSPVASVEPTLSVPGVRAALRHRRGPTVAVSPIAMRRPPACERDERRTVARARLLAAVGSEATPVAVARRYSDFIDVFVLDGADADDAADVLALGLRPAIAPVTAASIDERAALVECLMQLAVERTCKYGYRD